jgi:alpha-1,2-mannosyltransferase
VNFLAAERVGRFSMAGVEINPDILDQKFQARQRAWKRAAIIGALVVYLIQGVRIAGTERGDFNLHWELGRRLAAGEYIYHNGLDYPYPPFWAAAHAPLTLVPMHVAHLMLFPLFIVAFLVLLKVLNGLSGEHWRLKREAAFWTGVVAVLFTSRYLVRDMPECGVNLALVALSWLSIFLWTERKEWRGGLSLGFAISLKCTPLFFLAYFGWKRQWKMFATTTLFACIFSLSPLLFMGPKLFHRSVDFWSMMAWRGVGVSDPSHGVLGAEPLQNDSFRPAAARFLIHLPDDHKARLDHPLYLDFLNLDPGTAGLVIKGLLFLMILGGAWAFRQRITSRNSPEVLWECAAISAMILLVSPITWGQHCVGVFPAFYLFTRSAICGAEVRPWMKRFLLCYLLFTLLLNREFVGQTFARLLDTYHVQTWCVMGLVALCIVCRFRDGEFSRGTLRTAEFSGSSKAGPLLESATHRHAA